MKVFVDTAAVMEKPLAAAAGLGWQGKHTNLVSREHGSWLFLGAIFTTLELAADAAEIDHCGSCRACLDVCPTDAFPAPYRLDARRCISYLTIEHKGPIPRDLRAPMGNRIYGCDDCLAVCPWNKFAQAGREAKLAAREALRAPKLAELARLDDAAFRALFAKSPVKRTGRDRFVRNVLIAIGNSGDAALAAEAERLLDDASPLVRGAAVWALARLDPARLRAALDQASARARPTRRARRMERGVMMPTLFCFGLGYSASHYIAEFGGRFDRIAGTVRTREKAAAIAVGHRRKHTVEAFVFDGSEATPEITAAVMDANAHPGLGAAARGRRSGAGAFRRHDRGRAASAQHRLSLDRRRLRRPRRRWVDETTPPAPVSKRSRERLAAEQAWIALGAARRKAVAILRLSGIYGPGQNALHAAQERHAPSASTSRVSSSTASMSPTSRRRSTRRSTRSANGVFNVTDDEPTPQGVPIAFAAELLGVEPPPEIPFAEAAKGMTRWRCRSMARASACATTGSSASSVSRCAIRPFAKVCARCSRARRSSG